MEIENANQNKNQLEKLLLDNTLKTTLDKIQHLFEPIDVLDQTEPKYRPTQSNNNTFQDMLFTKLMFNSRKLPLGPSLPHLVDAPSSGSETEKEPIKNDGPSVQDVSRYIFDYKLFKQISPTELSVQNHTALLFEPLPLTMTAHQLSNKLGEFTSLNIDTSIKCIKIASKGDNAIGYINFIDNTQASIFYNKIQTEKTNDRAFKNNWNADGRLNDQIIDVNWGIDTSECSDSDWVGVVFRGLPSQITNERIIKNCEKRGGNVKYIIDPRNIKGKLCCIAVVESLDDGHKICHGLNNSKLNKEDKINKLKVHLHPISSKISLKNKNSTLFPNLFKKEECKLLKINPKGKEIIARERINGNHKHNNLNKHNKHNKHNKKDNIQGNKNRIDMRDLLGLGISSKGNKKSNIRENGVKKENILSRLTASPRFSYSPTVLNDEIETMNNLGVLLKGDIGGYMDRSRSREIDKGISALSEEEEPMDY